MRDLTQPPVNQFRMTNRDIIQRFGSTGDVGTGAFLIPPGYEIRDYKTRSNVRVIASDGGGWDHVSVSCEDRCPIWDEMCVAFHLFFYDDETAVQYHVPTTEHYNVHPHVLHLWRPHGARVPLPPRIML